MPDGTTTTTSGNTVTNVAAGKPKIGGALYIGPTTATMPTDATTALGTDFKCLGYISEDGLTNASEKESQVIKAWGGDPVVFVDNGQSDSFKFKLLEVLNLEVLKLVYGSANVTGSLSAGIAVAVKGAPENAAHALVAELVLRGAVKRIVVPFFYVTTVAEIVYRDNEAVGYDTTIAALPDSDGNTHYEYIKGAST